MMGKVQIEDNNWVRTEIGSTNGIHYIDRANKIDTYPEYDLPAKKAQKKNSLMLDIGSGWGRWLIAASRKSYIPIGLDLKIDHARSALKTIRHHQVNGYLVVGDLQDMPFQDDTFDLIWSFSVIQHTHYDKLVSCVNHLKRILAKSGKAKLEFPNKNGIRNKMKYGHLENDMDMDSLHVRYYNIKEYLKVFKRQFSKVKISIHSFLGIGVLPDDLKYVSRKNKPLVALSLLSTAIARIIPGAKNLADSIYINLEKTEGPQNTRLSHFLKHHWLKQNLNIVYLLQCPISGGPVYLSADSKFIISDSAGVKYPVIDEIPIMLKSAAIPMEKISATKTMQDMNTQPSTLIIDN